MNPKERTWAAGGAVACLLVLVAGWFLLVSPKKAEIATVQGQTASQVSSNATLRGQIAQLQAQSKGLVAKQAELQAIGRRIPAEPQLPALLRALTVVHNRSGVDVISVTPSAPSPAAAGAGAAPYATIPVALTLQGDYSQMTMFLDELETLQRVFLVKNLTVTPNKVTAGARSPDGSPEGNRSLSATISGEVFMSASGATTASLPALAGAPGTSTPPVAAGTVAGGNN